jgi:hypothetical protein
MALLITTMAKTAFAKRLGALMMVASTIGAYAGEILIPNSTSPDGRYAIYAVDANENFLPTTLEIRGLKDQRPRIKLDGGGWVELASSYCYGDEDKDSIFVVWNSEGSRIAMMVRDGKRSGSLLICEREGDSFRQISKLPDFLALAEKALGLKRDGRYVYEFPQIWIGQDKLLIKMRFDDVALADSKPYQFEYTFEFDIANGKTSKFKVLSKTLEEG